MQLGYVSQQLGHADVAVTARHYARWAGGESYRAPMPLRIGEVPADLLARLGRKSPQSPPTRRPDESDGLEESSEFPGVSGGPPGTRTLDQRVKSPVREWEFPRFVN